MNSNENPYSPPSSVASPDMTAKRPASYAWIFAVGTTVGLLMCGVILMGAERFVRDVINSPLEFLSLVAGSLVIGLPVGWLTRDRRPTTNSGVAKAVRFLSGFAMGVLPPFFQDLLDWLSQRSSIPMTVQLSLGRFVATIVLAVIAAIVLERVLRLMFVRRPDFQTQILDHSDSAHESG